MNDILNRGFVSPYIQFIFGNGLFSLDTLPPRYFSSFEQTRTVKEACSFTLNLTYAPGLANEKTADIIHRVLLSSVNLPVTYQYGYKTPGGGLQLQNVAYAGKFLEYTESLESDGTLSYIIKGTAHEVDKTGQIYNIQDFLNNFAYNFRTQPSRLVSLLVDENYDIGYRYFIPEIREFFKDYTFNIEHTDDSVVMDTIQIPNGTIRDIFCGKTNKDNTYNPSGFVSYSNRYIDNYQQALSEHLISNDLYQALLRSDNEYSILNRYASSSLKNWEAGAQIIYNSYEKIRKIPFVCFFDNVIDSIGSTGKGKFNYVEKSHRQVTNVFFYNYGNNFLDSDVISFQADYSGAIAMSSVGALQNMSSNIDANGQQISSNYNIVQNDAFTRNSYSTLSGFNEDALVSNTVVSDALTYPYTAKMTVVGQTEVLDLNLMDTIRVNIFVNGVEHPTLSGEYQIQGISDSLSASGFTTDFDLVRLHEQNIDNDIPEYVSNNTPESNAYENQEALNKG